MVDRVEYTASSFQCSECEGEEFHYGILQAPLKFALFRKAAVQCSVCLSCGHVFTFVDDADLERIRAWKAGEVANA